MKTLGFYGASDDLFIAEIDGHPTDELSDAARGTTMAFLVQSESAGAGLIVTAIYEHPLTEAELGDRRHDAQRNRSAAGVADARREPAHRWRHAADPVQPAPDR